MNPTRNSTLRCIPAELYFPAMPHPIRVSLSADEAAELEFECRCYTLPTGVQIYTHPRSAEACAACYTPAQLPAPQMDVVFNWALFDADACLVSGSWH